MIPTSATQYHPGIEADSKELLHHHFQSKILLIMPLFRFSSIGSYKINMSTMMSPNKRQIISFKILKQQVEFRDRQYFVPLPWISPVTIES